MINIKNIERDMRDFENNKDIKLVELQVSEKTMQESFRFDFLKFADWLQSSVEQLKKSLANTSTSVKTLQRELQAAQLDFGSYSPDIWFL